MKYIKLIMLCLATVFLMGTSLHADQERAPLNDQPLTKEQYVAAVKKIAADAEEAEKEEQNIEETNEQGSDEEVSDEETVTNGFNPNDTSHNSSRHIFKGVTQFFDQVELQDGSYWLVRPEDRTLLNDWVPGDTIAVTQSTRFWWFRYDNYNYALYNERTRRFVEVEMSASPILGTFYHRYIESISYQSYNAYLVLNDKTVWKLNESERGIWGQWQPGNTIVIGTNNGWRSWSFPNILINVGFTKTPIQSTTRF